MTTTRADQPSGTQYTATPAKAGTLCDWCDESAAAFVTPFHPAGFPHGRDWMCREHFNEYHPTLTINATSQKGALR